MAVTKRWRRAGQQPGAGQRGVALLVVLWLAVALGLIAFTTASMVRSDVDTVSNEVDGGRAYFMARGAVEQAVDAIIASRSGPPDARQVATPASYQPGRRWLRFDYGQGWVLVEVVPENAKLSLNAASEDSLRALFAQLRSPESAAELAQAMVQWRSGQSSDVPSRLDAYYAGLAKPYEPRHAPLEDLEEALAVRGMTTDLFYGAIPAAGRSEEQQAAPSLPDLVSVQKTQSPINVNYAPVEVLATLPGWDRALAARVVRERGDDALYGRPYVAADDLVHRVPATAALLGVTSYTLNAGDDFTLIATAFLNDAGLSRTVRALVRLDSARPTGHRVEGWWDEWPWSPPVPDIVAAAKGAL